MRAMLRAATALLLLAVLAACGSPSSVGLGGNGAECQRATEEPIEELLARANAALQAKQLFDPPEGNALALFLEVSKREADADPAKRRRLLESVSSGDPQQQARLALNDLFPYGLARVEQAIRSGDLEDAGRILALLERAQPGAGSVQRLRVTYDAAFKAWRAALRSTDLDSLPALISKTPPRYPPRAERRGIEGWVHLSFAIQPDGSVTEVKVMAAEPEGMFDREAIAALSRWRFQAPGRQIRAQRRVEFRLLGND
jgi:TonB family protein